MTPAVAALLVGAVVAAGLPRIFMRLEPRARRTRGRTVPPPRRVRAPAVSIVVPARNEAARLPRLLTSLAGAGATPGEVIVVDDHSTDDTAAIARAAGARVVTPGPLPDGWTGKAFACAAGAADASGSHLLFLDADAWFEPGGLAALLDAADADAAWSLCPYHRVERPYESLSLYFNVLMVAGTAASGRALFGQALLIPREAYDAVGGHGAVRGHILENFFLGGLLARRGVRVVAVPGREQVAMRMYPGGLADLTRGWMKAFATGAAGTPAWVLALSVLWMGGAIASCVLLATGLARGDAGVAFVAFAAAFLHAMELRRVSLAIGNYPWAASLLFPAPLLFYQVTFARGALRKALGVAPAWKSRTVDGA